MHLECPLTSGHLGQYFVPCYDVTTLRMCTSKDAKPELRHSRCLCCHSQALEEEEAEARGESGYVFVSRVGGGD